MAVGVYLVADDDTIVWSPAASTANTGMRVDEVVGQSIFRFIHPDDHDAATAYVKRLRDRPGSLQTVRLRTRHPALPETYFDFQYGGLYLPNDDVVPGVLLWATNVAGSTTDDAWIANVAELSPFVVLNVAWPNRVVGRSGRIRDLLGPVGEDDDALAWVQCVQPEWRPAVEQLVASARQGERLPAVQARYRADDRSIWLRIELVPISGNDGTPRGAIVTFLDVTSDVAAREQLEQSVGELWHQANHDGLTGLPNRMLFLDRVEQAQRRMWRDATSPGVLVCDLDDFKAVNDTFGHVVGDEVLIETARRLSESVREADTVSRFGGDEFCVLVDDTGGREKLRALGERILATFGEPMDVAEESLRVGITVGATLLDEAEVGESIERADRALLRAKGVAKGRVEVTGSEPGGSRFGRVPAPHGGSRPMDP